MSNEHERFDFLRIVSFGRRKKRGDPRYATMNRRALASTLDSMILVFLSPVFSAYAPIDTGVLSTLDLDQRDPGAGEKILHALLTDPDFIASWTHNFGAQLIAFFVISGLCWHFWSATPGKMIMRIKVVDAETEKPLTDLQILLRICGYIISGMFFFLGFFWIAFDKRRQGWHDKLAESVVVVIPWRKPAQGAAAP